jgi:hypothetical protein
MTNGKRKVPLAVATFPEKVLYYKNYRQSEHLHKNLFNHNLSR